MNIRHWPSFLSGALAGSIATASLTAVAIMPDEVTLKHLSEIWNRIATDHVEPVDDAKLFEGCLDGMLAGLDSGSAYIDADEFRGMSMAASSKLGGIGIEAMRRGDQIVVVAPLDGTPSAQAGMRAGDVILAIDSKPLDGKHASDAMAMLRGEPGSEVRLRVRRKDLAEPLDLRVKRERLDIRPVKGRWLGEDQLYLRISSFTTQTATDIERELGRARREGNRTPPRGLVVDLRNNPGGVLDSAVKSADLFVEEGLIVSLQGRTPESVREFHALPTVAVPGRPRIAVLVNGGSAAASEILASALRKHAGAVILGQRTFGRGSIQTIMPLHNEGALKLTTSRWHDAEGELLEGKGLAPDIELPDPPNDLPLDAPDPWLERAQQVLRQ